MATFAENTGLTGREPGAATLDAATTPGLHLLFAYAKGSAFRVYDLRVLDDGYPEVWLHERVGEVLHTARQAFLGSDDCADFLEEEQESLLASGWEEVTVQ